MKNLVSPLWKSRTVWSFVAAVGSALVSVSDFIPEKYKPLVNAVGVVFASAAAVFAREAGVEAAKKVGTEVAASE